MTITVHVETCPTCHGATWINGVETPSGEGPCPACRIVPGCDVPDPWFVVVPMAAHGGSHKGATGWYAPDPDWQPGASVTLTADCPDCHPDNWTGDRNVIDHLHEHGALREAVEAMDGEACCTNGEVPVGSAVIADLVPVYGDPEVVPIATIDAYVRVYRTGGVYLFRRVPDPDMADRTTWAQSLLDVTCAPGDTLARLETTDD